MIKNDNRLIPTHFQLACPLFLAHNQPVPVLQALSSDSQEHKQLRIQLFLMRRCGVVGPTSPSPTEEAEIQEADGLFPNQNLRPDLDTMVLPVDHHKAQSVPRPEGGEAMELVLGVSPQQRSSPPHPDGGEEQGSASVLRGILVQG